MTINPDTHSESLVDLPRDAFLRTGTLRTKRNRFYRDVVKRVFDVAVVMICSAPIVLVIGLLALAVSIQGGRPFYVQDRVGRDGRIYRMWKLRTMVIGADDKLATLLEDNLDANAEWAETQKLKDDPRITRFGKVLRRTSLDELPQLWNVLIGDMSLVGPRPMMPEQREMYDGQAYFRLRPGITGPWQVSDRNKSAFTDRAAFDTDYERDMSLGHDLGLIGATAGAVFRATGY